MVQSSLLRPWANDAYFSTCIASLDQCCVVGSECPVGSGILKCIKAIDPGYIDTDIYAVLFLPLYIFSHTFLGEKIYSKKVLLGQIKCFIA